ncbi:MAG: hypothetical protein FWE14_01055 [Lachnospiraceae bacterium]|nr:hypothetical protein [Lachnospiraceae bacterium]
MNEKIAKGFYDSVVDEGIQDYKKVLTNNLDFTYGLIEQYKPWMDFYDNLSDTNKELFFSFIKQTIIDTVSTVFGIIDGPTTFSIPNTEFKLYINDEDSDMDMQGSFLAYVQDKENNN